MTTLMRPLSSGLIYSWHEISRAAIITSLDIVHLARTVLYIYNLLSTQANDILAHALLVDNPIEWGSRQPSTMVSAHVANYTSTSTAHIIYTQWKKGGKEQIQRNHHYEKDTRM